MKREVVVFGGRGAGAMVVQSVRRLAAAGVAIETAGVLNDELQWRCRGGSVQQLASTSRSRRPDRAASQGEGDAGAGRARPQPRDPAATLDFR